ncbi:MAG: amidohydrolase family protein [Acidobacteriota bacterium]
MDKLTRRDLIRKTAAGSAALAIAGLPACSSTPQEPPATPEDLLKNTRLFDYHPRTMLTVKKTEITRAKFPVIDAHNHLRRDVVNADVDISEMVKIMDDCSVQIVVDLDGYPGGQLEKSLERLKKAYPDRFLVYTRIDWTNLNDPDFGEQMARKIEEDVEKGAQALKIRKELGLEIQLEDGTYLQVDTPKLDPAWEACARLGIPVTIHVGDPLAFFTPLDIYNERLEEVIDHPDWMWNKPELYGIYEIFEQRNRMLAKHPNTNFIGAHIGGISENLELAGEWLDTYPNLYYDTSARIHEMGRQPFTAREFLIKYADRILFGTDGCEDGHINANMFHLNWRWYETNDEYFDVSKAHHYQGRWMVYGISLPDDVLKKIYYQNALKLYPGINKSLFPA